MVMSWGWKHERFTQNNGTTVRSSNGDDEHISVRDERGKDETVDSYAERCWMVVAELEEKTETMRTEHENKLMTLETRHDDRIIALEAELAELRRGMEEIGVLERKEPEPAEEPHQG